ncbi:MAG: queuine tRNA-ribosyltransferase [Candidatus Krumholzibacteriia bacterium]
MSLGSDIVMAFDQCAAYSAEPAEVERAVERTTRWLKRCRDVFGGRAYRGGWERVLFGIMQGGVDPALRKRSAEEIVELDLPGYAIGGLSVGEPISAMREITDLATDLLPLEKPRYLMGVGFPNDIMAAVRDGVDMFDCVLPTRMARTGTALTRDGRLVIKNQVFANDPDPIDSECGCPVCARHSRAYIRHLFQAREILGATLVTIHNLHYYQELMADIRLAIDEDRYSAFAAAGIARWEDGETERMSAIKARKG